MSYNSNSNSNDLPNSRPATDDGYAGPSVETLMETLYFRDRNGAVRPFIHAHKDLQSMLRALKPWQVLLLGHYASMFTALRENTLWEAKQSLYTSGLIPTNMSYLLEAIWFHGVEGIDNLEEFGYPLDAWHWIFREDPTQPRQVNRTSGSAPSAQARWVYPEHPKPAYDWLQAGYPSKRRLKKPRAALQQEQGASSPTWAPYRAWGPNLLEP